MKNLNFLNKTGLCLTKGYKKIESTLGSMKFAVVIIMVFALALVYGTFMESYHGRDFANKLVYKSWWFMGLQLCMFLSILVATLNRLPVKKVLYGFYTLHAGLLILFIGSFLTYTAGIDGMLELMPNEPANNVRIEEDQFVVGYPDGQVKIFTLPTSAFGSKMYFEEPGLKIKKYLPFSKLETVWMEEDQKEADSAVYTIYNENVSEELIMSLHPESDFQSMQKLGPLSTHYMPQTLYKCFISETKSGFLVWDTEKDTCHTAEAMNYEIKSTPTNNRFMIIPYKGEYLKFFPDFSPLALTDNLDKRQDTPYRVFSKKLFEKKPNLFLFGDKTVFFHKRKGWTGREFEKNKPVKLPWMNFKLTLDSYRPDHFPAQIPTYMRPIQDQGEIIEGDIKAVLIEFYGKDYWVRSDQPLALSDGDKQVRFQIRSREVRLPYQITLDRFKMDKNPGTNDPASFESFVSLLDGRTATASEQHHVFMNNPLKYDEFTFYQSSYFQVGPDEYGSAFSVNYDPGRPIKYAGSLLLVLGSSWHFLLRRRKKRRFFEKETTIESDSGEVNV
ncbi:MAG: cytochrome c biogenesis protein ResB [Bacteriovoracaceae bacterium]|nr:cytochrome c biogenesis protein ResB [Bacteriovoracaceae bacterium]